MKALSRGSKGGAKAQAKARADAQANAKAETTNDTVVAKPGEHRGGQRGTIIKDDGPGDNTPYKVKFSDGNTHWYRANQVERAGAASASDSGDVLRSKQVGVRVRRGERPRGSYTPTQCPRTHPDERC